MCIGWVFSTTDVDLWFVLALLISSVSFLFIFFAKVLKFLLGFSLEGIVLGIQDMLLSVWFCRSYSMFDYWNSCIFDKDIRFLMFVHWCDDGLQDFFEIPRGQPSRNIDIEMGTQALDQGLESFFKKVKCYVIVS